MTTTGDSRAQEARIVLIDDDPLIHALVKTMLKPLGVTIVSANNGDEGLQLARDERTDMILLDNELPGASGLEVLKQLKSDPELSSLPVIMQTANDSKLMLAACFAAGAVDYVHKPFSSAELRARVGSVLERQQMLAELTRAAHTDKLTGLANRTALNKRLDAALQRMHESENYQFTLMFLDFDRFKFTNDTLGHDVGDLLLQGIAARLRTNVRGTDTVLLDPDGNTIARLGGDEFVVILEGTNRPDAVAAVANRLLETLSAPYQLGRHTVRSTASIGLVFSSQDYRTGQEILRDADIAMYEAKRRGRACQVAFSAGMRDATRDRHALELDFREAIGTGQFYLAYQPVVSLEDSSVVGIEALARWRHPTRGDITPEIFIPLAEESRLITPFSDWMLREACERFTEFRIAAGDDAPGYLSVNLSRVQLADQKFVKHALRIADSAGVRPHQLQVEFTESQIVQHRGVALEVLREFKANGVRVAMDDFGTGQSSLACLQELPLDVLKIDGTFVASASRGHHYAALLHAVITLADNLELSVVAEGVETIEQVALLQTLGCSFAQGHFISPPISAPEVVALLTSNTVTG